MLRTNNGDSKDLASKALIIDDESFTLELFEFELKAQGFEVTTASSGNEGIDKLRKHDFDVVLTDLNMPDINGIDMVRNSRSIRPFTEILVVTGDDSSERAVEAIREGAFDYILKPVDFDKLFTSVRNAVESKRQAQLNERQAAEIKRLRDRLSSRTSFEGIIGGARSMQNIYEIIENVADSDANILILGESGTGKDLVAKAIHYGSQRSDRPFVAVNCAALPATLIESELFGYEKGAFTDAKARKEGLFEQAEGGTLLLDEIGELELSLQAKLLRVLEEGAFRRVGGLKDIPLDVRVLAASNRDLKTESEGGRFRLDLYYRLSIIQIDIPPLRERGDDVLLLSQHYIDTLGARLKRNHKITGISPEAAAVFRNYRWPGNVRELRNVIERALILEDSDQITTEYLPGGLLESPRFEPAALASTQFVLPNEGISLDEAELSFVRQAIERSGGNQTRAAELLGISRDQLRYRLKKLEDAQVAIADAET